MHAIRAGSLSAQRRRYVNAAASRLLADSSFNAAAQKVGAAITAAVIADLGADVQPSLV